MSDNLEISDEYLIKDVEVCKDRLIGQGSYAVVYVATYHHTEVAAKKLHSIFFEDVNPKEYKGILLSWLNELKIMHSLRHPNIVQFYGVFNSEDTSSMSLTKNSYIISELLKQSLQARNLEKPRLTIKQIIDIAMGIAAGLCYLHNRRNPIMHRDLASKNILLSFSGQAKIADLGVAKFTVQVQQSHTRHPGTDYYMPLETVICDDSYDHSIDVYALGVIILEMATGKNPTATQSLKKVDNLVKIVPETERRKEDFSELKKSHNVVLNNVIIHCLQEKEKRISASQVITYLDEVKNTEAYKSCKETSIFEMANDTALEHNQILKGIQKENESLKKETERLKKENEKLNKMIQAHEKKIEELEDKIKQESKRNLERTSLTPQMQQSTLSQYVPSGSSQMPTHPTTSSMVVPKQKSYSFDQPSKSLQNQDQPPRSLQNLDKPPKSLHNFDQPPRSLQSRDQPPHLFQSHDQPSRSLQHDRPPASLQSRDQPPRSLQHNRPPASLQSRDQPPRSLQSRNQPPRSLHSLDQLPRSSRLFHNLDQPPRSLQSYDQVLGSPTHPFYGLEADKAVPARNSLDNDFLSLPARLSNIPTAQKAADYLTYQLSCMERVILQLKSANSNASEHLITSFVAALQEQVLKTTDYISNLPNYSDQRLREPLQKIYQALSGAHFDNISYTYAQELNKAITLFRGALNSYTQQHMHSLY